MIDLRVGLINQDDFRIANHSQCTLQLPLVNRVQLYWPQFSLLYQAEPEESLLDVLLDKVFSDS